jgi:hypothetical protein
MSATPHPPPLHGTGEFGSEQMLPTSGPDGVAVIIRHNYSGTFSVRDAGTRALLDVFDSYPAARRYADGVAHPR